MKRRGVHPAALDTAAAADPPTHSLGVHQPCTLHTRPCLMSVPLKVVVCGPWNYYTVATELET